MKRKLMLFNLFLAWTGLAFAIPLQFLTHRRAAFAGTGVTYLLEENWEGTGLGSWTKTGLGSFDPDVSTSGLSLEGNECLFQNLSATSATVYSASFTAQSTVYLYFMIRSSLLPSGVNVIIAQLETASDAECARIRFTSTGKLEARAGGGTVATTTDSFLVDTTYHVWVTYASGTGGNAICTVEFSTDGTKVGSGNKFASSANGTATASAERVQLGQSGSATQQFYYDKIRVDDVVIGSNPS